MQKDKPILEVCFSPALLHLFDLKNTIVVVIDIFRATTTICVAIANGAHKIYPFLEVDDCLDFKAKHPHVISAGERDGKIIDGMDRGNSPSDYPTSFIQQKEIALTTTNGTKVLHMSSDAEQIIIGSFVNLQTVIDYLKSQNKKVLLACAAWKDKVNMEDTLFAGAVVNALQDDFEVLCDSAKMSQQLWKTTNNGAQLYEILKESSHYRRLSRFGAQNDLKICTTLNSHPSLPIFTKASYLVDKKTENTI